MYQIKKAARRSKPRAAPIKKRKVVIYMFVSVKSLTALIDQDIQFYIDGVASKEQHSPEEFEKWHKYIKSRLVEQLSKLKKISCNKKLIATYENKINELLK